MRDAYNALRVGKWDDAERILTGVLKSNPDQTMAYLYLGIVLRNKAYATESDATRKDLLKRAEQRFEEGLLIDPFEARISYQLATLQYEMAQAIADREERKERLKVAKDTFQKLILLAPMTREAHLQFSMICVDQIQLGLLDGEPGEELRKELVSIADEGLMHSKLVVTLESRRKDPGSVELATQLTAQLYKLRAQLVQSEEERELSLTESRKWQARAEQMREPRGPILIK